MLPELKRYLATVSRYSKLDSAPDGEVTRELQTHFEDEIEELCDAGYSGTEAVKEATRRFGHPREIGREIYEAYSKGTWSQVLLSVMPHILIALTFALHLWRANVWLLLLSIVVASMTIYAWRRGTPVWIYSWLGYCFIVILAVEFLLIFGLSRVAALHIPVAGSLWIVIPVFAAVAVLLLGFIMIQVTRRDWLYSSLTLLPLPLILVWLVALGYDVGYAHYARQAFENSDSKVAITFLSLAVITAAFIRLRPRYLKIGVLSLGILLIQALVWRFVEREISPAACLILAIFFMCLLVSPVILHHRVIQGQENYDSTDQSLPEQVIKRM